MALSSLNINTASIQELELIPGATINIVNQIISNRPYTEASQLTKAGLNSVEIAKLAPILIFTSNIQSTPVTTPTIPTVSVAPTASTTPSVPVSTTHTIPVIPTVNISVGTTAFPVKIISPQEDLVAILNKAQPNTLYQCQSGQTYTPDGQVAPTVGDWQLDGNHAKFNWNLPPNAAKACFKYMRPNIVVYNLNLSTNVIAVESVASNCVFRDSTISDGSTQIGIAQSLNGVGAGDGTIFKNLKCGKTNSVSLYSCVSDVQIINCSFAGSVGETTIRFSTNALTNQHPANNIVNGCSIVSGGYEKGCGEFRNAINAQFINNKCSSYLRVGQANQPNATNAVNGILIKGNSWVLPQTSDVQTHLLLMSGTTAIIESNDFIVNNTMECAQVWGPGRFTFVQNRRHANGPGVVPRPKIYNPASTGGATVIDDNPPYIPYN